MTSVQEVTVSQITEEAEGIRSFVLTPVAGALLPFTAGAHIDVHLPNGLVRQYSLLNDPGRRETYTIAVLREPASRGGSLAMHALKPGDRLRISAPRNLFPLVEEATRTLLLAGGIGITPILAMAWRLHALGRPFTLHACARTAARAPFHDFLRTAPFAQSVSLHFDDGPAEQRFDTASTLADPGEGGHLYVCGPGGFMEHVLSTARAAGWHETQLHREYFTAAAPDAAGDQPFDLEIASTGAVIAVPPGRTALECLLAHGVDVPMSCEQGICGTCLVSVLDGIPEHRDSYMTEEEHAANTQFTPCCSRAKTARLVLDL
ncbi:PDR/VanB family oxidoreductase [Acidisoma sp. 7E03]